MTQKLKNYIIKNGKVILLLEKDIYSRNMLNEAGRDLASECKMTLSDKKDDYEIILTFKNKNLNLENLAILFNDTLIGNVFLYQ